MQTENKPTTPIDGAERDRKQVLADRYKTRMCRNYEESGKCPYENKCMFAHGDVELRTTEMNIDDGLVTDEAIKAFQRQQIIKRQQEAAIELQQQRRLHQQQQQQAYRQQYSAYSSPPTYNNYYYGSSGGCQCPDCLNGYTDHYGNYGPAPMQACEESCQCADCISAYKQYGSYPPAHGEGYAPEAEVLEP